MHYFCLAFKATISYLQCRHQTTTINTAMLDLRIPKKIKRKSKQYAELLEGNEFPVDKRFIFIGFYLSGLDFTVADHTMTNRKATVKKLNVVQLAILMDQPDIGLDNLHMIRSNINEINRKRIQQYDPETANDVFLLQVRWNLAQRQFLSKFLIHFYFGKNLTLEKYIFINTILLMVL